MADPSRRRHDRLRLAQLLHDQPGLRLLPAVGGEVRLVGTLVFAADSPGIGRIDDAYEIEITVPERFPEEPAVVKEMTGRIPETFHTNPDGSLCLGSPVRLRLELAEAPTLPAFIDRCVVPYLYGFSHRERHGRLPFGELAHGWRGILEDYADLFGIETASAAVGMVRLAAMKRRVANKYPCPCGSARRLGRCHHGTINPIRARLGRRWLRQEHHRLNEMRLATPRKYRDPRSPAPYSNPDPDRPGLLGRDCRLAASASRKHGAARAHLGPVLGHRRSRT